MNVLNKRVYILQDSFLSVVFVVVVLGPYARGIMRAIGALVSIAICHPMDYIVDGG